MMPDIRETLRSGKPSIGSWMQLPNTSVAEIMGQAGYDWIAVDLEHGAFSRQILPDLFRALELGGTVPFARVARVDPDNIKQALDAGARGLILPMVEAAGQLKKALSWATYPPGGNRGVGYCRANQFGKAFHEGVKASGDILIVAQIETADAVVHLDEILSVEGLDAVMVGPYDLSGSLDVTGDFDHLRFSEVMENIFKKAGEHGVPCGLHVVQPDVGVLRSKVDEGYRFIAFGIDAVFLYCSAGRPLFE